eukprot:1176820-Prorocentrum_minimum.AAC.9
MIILLIILLLIIRRPPRSLADTPPYAHSLPVQIDAKLQTHVKSTGGVLIPEAIRHCSLSNEINMWYKMTGSGVSRAPLPSLAQEDQ